MALEQFLVSWDNFHKDMRSGMSSLLENEDFVDVTLAIEGRYLKAHKMVLSVCSSYFRELFKTTPCRHPIVFMKDVSYTAMSDLLQFMYKGEVQVNQENFNTFINTAESLQIRGLSNNGSVSSGTVSHHKVTKVTSQNLIPKQAHQSSPVPVVKRSRLEEHKAPNPNEIVKTELVEETAFSEEPISYKTQPFTEQMSPLVVSDDNSNDNYLDDPLDETKNEDYWMREGYQGQGHSKEGTREGDLEESASATSLVIPEKSKDRYENTFNRFEVWCGKKGVKNISENVVMTYFKEKSINCKSSSLWSTYSMLRSMILMKKNLDISRYRNLLIFLRRQSKGYKAKKTEAFTREEFEKFLKEANDETFLMMKVAMIIGVVGACRSYELTYLRMENVIDEGNFIRVQLPDADNKISREFIVTPGNIKDVNLIEIIRKYIKLRPSIISHQRFFVAYQYGKCTKQAIGNNTFGSVPKKIAQFLGLPNAEEYTGHCFRRTSTLIKYWYQSQ